MKERSNGVYMQKVHIPILVFLFSFCIMTQVQGEQGLYFGRVKPPTVQKIVIAN